MVKEVRTINYLFSEYCVVLVDSVCSYRTTLRKPSVLKGKIKPKTHTHGHNNNCDPNFSGWGFDQIKVKSI